MNAHLRTVSLAVLAGLGFGLAQGHVSLPIFGVLGAVAALQFMRRWPWWLGLSSFAMISVAANELAYVGTVPLPWIGRLGVFSSIGLALGAIFVAQARATSRRPGLMTALILPTGWASLEFALGAFSPTGTWGSVAYGFVRPILLPVAQLAAFTGWIGLTFVVGWLAATLDLLLERPGRRPAVVLVIFLAVIVTGGWLRPALAPGPSTEISVSMIHGPTLPEAEDGELLQAHYLGWELDAGQRDAVPKAAARYRDEMFSLLEAEAVRGADLITWAEVMVWLAFDDEDAWVARAQQLAREHGVTLALGVGVFDPARSRPYENALLVIDGHGELVADYLKSKATPGAWHVVGDGELPQLAMPWGRLSTAICYDLDFPRLLQQTGRAGTQVLLAPSFDDNRVRYMHSRMATMRAIEEGFTLVRPTAFGVTTVVDPYGRIVAHKDAYDGGEMVLRGKVPVYDVTTAYPWLGDVFGFVCCAGFVILVLSTVIGPRREALAAERN